MNIKQLLGTQAYWTINKEMAKMLGIYPTLLLQHFIDLDESFFKGMESGFYQQQQRLEKDLPMSISQIRNATSFLVKEGLINVKRVGVPPKYHYSLNYETIGTLIFKDELSKRLEALQERLRIKDIKETNNKDNTNISDVSSDDDIKGKMFFKLVDMYPKNRIGNRQHGLKKFKTLDIEEAKLALVNLKRYLKVAGTYVKNLQNYITEECWSESWLKAEETKSTSSNINKPDTKTISIEF